MWLGIGLPQKRAAASPGPTSEAESRSTCCERIPTRTRYNA
jgi:hypothetical protein